MEAGQFAFTVTADDETAAKLGLKTGKDAYAVAAAQRSRRRNGLGPLRRLDAWGRAHR